MLVSIKYNLFNSFNSLLFFNLYSFRQVLWCTARVPDVFNDYHVGWLIVPVNHFKPFINVP